MAARKTRRAKAAPAVTPPKGFDPDETIMVEVNRWQHLKSETHGVEAWIDWQATPGAFNRSGRRGVKVAWGNGFNGKAHAADRQAKATAEAQALQDGTQRKATKGNPRLKVIRANAAAFLGADTVKGLDEAAIMAAADKAGHGKALRAIISNLPY